MRSGRTLLQEIGEEAREAVQRVRRIAVAVHHVGRHGMVGPKDEVAGVDVVHEPVRGGGGWREGLGTGGRTSRSHRPALHALVQRARAREVRDQIFHLIRQHAAALQENVLRIGRRERHGSSCMPACSGVRDALALLHRRQADTTLLQVSCPPRLNGVT